MAICFRYLFFPFRMHNKSRTFFWSLILSRPFLFKDRFITHYMKGKNQTNMIKGHDKKHEFCMTHLIASKLDIRHPKANLFLFSSYVCNNVVYILSLDVWRSRKARLQSLSVYHFCSFFHSVCLDNFVIFFTF